MEEMANVEVTALATEKALIEHDISMFSQCDDLRDKRVDGEY